jgi:hypothetical protein
MNGVMISQVACGDNMGACVSDKGIVLSYGSGAEGALGHASTADVPTPRIIEHLLGHEITQVSEQANRVPFACMLIQIFVDLYACIQAHSDFRYLLACILICLHAGLVRRQSHGVRDD